METLIQSNKLTKEEENIVNEWFKYYPELSDQNQFYEVVEKVSGRNLNEMSKIRNKSIDEHPLIKEILFNKTESAQKLIKIINEYQDEISKFTFFNFFKPIIIYNLQKYVNELEKKDLIKNSKEFIMKIIIQGYNILYGISYRMLIFEVNYYREQGKLQGESSEERFKYFNEVILNDKKNLQKLFSEYYVLFQLLDKKIENYFTYLLDILKNTENDLENIEKIISKGKKLGKILSIQIGLGDTHKNGKSVATIYFENQKLMYKPQNLGMESAYKNLVTWLNVRIIKDKYKMLPLSFVKYYSTCKHTWMEFIEHTECKNEEEVKNFYKRIGEIIGLLYSLNSTDFHFENIIASGEFPMLIDLETLLRPSFIQEGTDAITQVNHMLRKSVSSMHILPVVEVNNDKRFNLGGLGGEKPQKSPYKIDFIKNSNMDTIKIDKDFAVINPKNNNPKLKGVNISSGKYLSYIKKGFEDMYRFILENKYKYSKKIEEIFSNKVCRFIPLSTSIYSRLLKSSYHPDVLRHEMDRIIFLNRIGLLVLTKDFQNLLIHEYRDLVNGDIPYFSVRTNEIYLYNSKNEKINNYEFALSPIENSKNIIKNFSIKDMNTQLSIIDCCYLYTIIDKERDYRKISLKNGFETTKTPFYPDKSKYLKLALTIGKHIVEKSITGIRENEIDRSWYGPFITGKDEVYTNISNVGFDLYRGNGGISLFLASLYRKTNDILFRKAAEEAIIPCYYFLADRISDNKINIGVGAFNGLASVAYTLYWVGELIGVDRYKKIAIEYISYIAEKKLNLPETNIDIISGVCGLLNVTIFLCEKSKNAIEKRKLINAANEFYNIVENTIINDIDDTFACQGNTGFAHGTSGISATLGRFYRLTKNENTIPLIQRLLEYDRSMYDPEIGNWYITPTKDKVSYGWCHGAPGILLSRILIKEYGYNDDKFDIEIKNALNQTIKYGFGNNDTFCHGDIGNLAIVKYVAKSLKDEKLENNCRYTFSKLVDYYISKSWNKPLFGNAEMYSLMVGMSGLGYSLLLNMDSNDLPKFLWLS